MIAMRWMLINQSESGHRVDVCEIDSKTRFLTPPYTQWWRIAANPMVYGYKQAWLEAGELQL